MSDVYVCVIVFTPGLGIVIVDSRFINDFN